MSNGTKYRYLQTILIFTVFGPWAGGLIMTFFMNLFFAVVNKQVGLLLNILVAPISSLGGIFFFFSASTSDGNNSCVAEIKKKDEFFDIHFHDWSNIKLYTCHLTVQVRWYSCMVDVCRIGILRFLSEWPFNVSGR